MPREPLKLQTCDMIAMLIRTGCRTMRVCGCSGLAKSDRTSAGSIRVVDGFNRRHQAFCRGQVELLPLRRPHSQGPGDHAQARLVEYLQGIAPASCTPRLSRGTPSSRIARAIADRVRCRAPCRETPAVSLERNLSHRVGKIQRVRDRPGIVHEHRQARAPDVAPQLLSIGVRPS